VLYLWVGKKADGRWLMPSIDIAAQSQVCCIMASTQNSKRDDKRQEILDVLRDATKKLTTASATSKIQIYPNYHRCELLNQAAEYVRKATSVLEFFWSHMQLYSTIDSPDYTNVVLYRFTIDDTGMLDGAKGNVE
jgi:hypothetical protein